MPATTAQSGEGDISAKYVEAILPYNLALLSGTFIVSAFETFF